MSKVYVPNNFNHTATDAERWGRLVYLTEGPVNRMAVRQHFKAIASALKGSRPDDYIVVGGLSVLTGLVIGAFMRQHGCANLLIWDRGDYRCRRVD